jgi:NLI interacting factor-like phosphatase
MKTAVTPSNQTASGVPTMTPPTRAGSFKSSLAQNPDLSPIASIKRPRSSLEQQRKKEVVAVSDESSSSKRPHTPPRRPLAAGTPCTTPMITSPYHAAASTPLSTYSPMHPPRAVHRNPNDGYVDMEESVEEKKKEEDEIVEEEDEIPVIPATSSWVGRKVDALFSPVLQLLANHESPSKKPLAVENEVERKTMDGPTEHSGSSTTRTSSSPGSSTASDQDSTFSAAVEVVTTDDVQITSVVDGDMADDFDEDHAEDQYDEDEFNPWQFIKCLPPYHSVQHLCPPVQLAPKSAENAAKLSVVLDLDETLVHCTVDPIPNPDLTFEVDFHNTVYTVNVKLRPHLHSFLRSISTEYEVIVFTASQKVYAHKLLNLIDPGTYRVVDTCFWGVTP